jgi:hypothetical protein
LSLGKAFAAAGSASLIAMALMLAPATAQPSGAERSAGRAIDPFTPAVSDPRLAAALARRGARLRTGYRFTPANAAPERSNAIRVAVRGRADAPDTVRRVVETAAASPVTAITPSSYNLGVSLGWRRFAIATDIAQADGGALPGRREAAQVGMTYRANNRLTGRVAVAAERADGSQRLVADDEAYSLDVGGAFSIARNIDVTAGARYRISRDRLEPLANEQRRDSQAVYVGTAFRF